MRDPKKLRAIIRRAANSFIKFSSALSEISDELGRSDEWWLDTAIEFEAGQSEEEAIFEQNIDDDTPLNGDTIEYILRDLMDLPWKENPIPGPKGEH